MKKGKVDRPFVIALLILVGFGLLMVFSASMYSSTVDGSKGYSLFLKQFGFVALGLLVMGFMSNIDYRKYNNKKIEAIICKTQFEDVKEALLEAKIEWFSYYNVKGIGKTCQGRI